MSRSAVTKSARLSAAGLHSGSQVRARGSSSSRSSLPPARLEVSRGSITRGSLDERRAALAEVEGIDEIADLVGPPDAVLDLDQELAVGGVERIGT